MKVVVKETDKGEAYIEIPQEMLEQLGWKEGDTLEWESKEDNNGLALSKENNESR